MAKRAIEYHVNKRDIRPRHLYTGVTGLKHVQGTLTEEYLNDLKSWDRESKIYLEMRDDLVVGTLLDAVKLPLMAADVSVEPATGNTPADQMAADWLDAQINGMQKQSWNSHIEDCLDCLDFGFSIGEIILSKQADGSLGLKNISPRGAETLWDWGFNDQGQAVSFRQRDPNTGAMYEIPLDRCVHVTWKGRKGNPQGKSLLRSLYRPYRFLRDLENFEGIGIEHDVGGLPVLKIKEGTTMPQGTDLTNIQSALESIRIDEAAYFISPPGADLVPYGSASKAYDIGAVIERKKKEILMRMFAQFLMLGMEDVGTQALVKGSQDFFSLGLEAVQNRIVEVWNAEMVPYLFSFNRYRFPGMSGYPTIIWEKPGKVDYKAMIDAFNTASGAKLLTPTDLDEDHFRSLLDLPELPEEERGKPRNIEQLPLMSEIHNPPLQPVTPPVNQEKVFQRMINRWLKRR
ncbi:MAG: hypothetical protein PHQ43_00105 [Dehalococcoidales bacterium]|nr:hypothetical protein [Dehalococcoidales bacterium]